MFECENKIIFLNVRDINIAMRNALFIRRGWKVGVEGVELCVLRSKRKSGKLNLSRKWAVQPIRIGSHLITLAPAALGACQAGCRFFFRSELFHLFVALLKQALTALSAGFRMRFMTIGYNFKFILIRARVGLSKRRERRGRFLLLRLGFSYRICVRLPRTIRVQKRTRRTISFAGTNARVFFFFCGLYTKFT